MLVYLIDSRGACNSPTARKIQYELKKLQQELLDNFQLDYQLHVSYEYFKPEVHLICRDYIPANTGDWQPQFSFVVCKNNRGIYLAGLRMSKELRRKGIGTFCVNWLKEFCENFGFTYIVLGTYKESKDFWTKLGFVEITNEEYEKKYPAW